MTKTTKSRPRKIRTIFDDIGCGVPAGRAAEVLRSQTDHSTLAWHTRTGTWDGADLYRYGSREALVDAYRRQESARQLGELARIVPVEGDR